MFGSLTCAETKGILEAVVLGLDGACLDLGLPSLISALAVFVGVVVALQLIARRLVRRIFSRPRRGSEVPDTDQGPIRSNRPM